MDRRGLVGTVCAVPGAAVVTAFIVAQTQLIRLVGTAEWTTALWPSLEWALGSLLIAAWYHADWPRWQWRILGPVTFEVLVLGAVLSVALWACVPGLTTPAFHREALLPTLVVALPLAAWCAAEEAVLRGALGRLTAAQPVAIRVAVLFPSAVLVSLLTGQLAGWQGFVAVAAVESMSVIGAIVGQPVAMLALRRWVLRMGMMLIGVHAVGFETGVPPLTRLPLPDVSLGVLLVVSTCVLWGCVMLLEHALCDAEYATKARSGRRSTSTHGGM